MADTLSTYFAVFKADLDGFTTPLRDAQKQAKELNDAAKPLTNLFNDIGASATKFGSILTVGLTAPIVAFGAVAVKNFDESAKAIAVMEAAIISTGGAAGRTAEQLSKLASSLEAKSIHDDDEILRGIIDTLLQFGNVSGKVFDDAAKASLNLADKLGKDLQSAAILVGKALDDPIKGLTALQRAGVTFTEGEKEVIKHLVETGKQAEAQALILVKLTEKVDGTSEAMAKAGTGPMKQLQNQIGNMSESWGKLITETMNPFIAKTSEVVKWIDSWSESTKVLVGVSAGIAASIGPALLAVGQLSFGISGMIPLINKMAVQFLGAEGAAIAFSTALSAVGWAAATAGAAALGFAIGSLVNHLIEASGHQATFDKILNTIVKTIPGFSLLATGTAQADDSAKSYNITLAAQKKYLDAHGKTLEDLNKFQAEHNKTVAEFSKVLSGSSTTIKTNTELTIEQSKAQDKLKSSIDGIVKSVTGDVEHTNALTGAVRALQAAHVPAEEIVKKLGTQIEAEAEFAKAAGKELNGTLAPLEALIVKTKNVKDETEKYLVQLKAQNKDLQTLIDISIAAQPGMAALESQLRSLNELKGPMLYVEGMQDLIDITDLANTKVKDVFDRTVEGTQFLADQVDVHAKRIEKSHKDTTDSIQRVWETAAGNITSGMAKAFTDILFHGGSFKDKMVDLAKSVAEQMMQSLLVGLFAPLTAKLAGLGSQLGGLIPGLGGAGGAVGSIGGAAGTAAGGSAAGGGAAGAIGGLLTNPWTIGIGAGLVAVGAWIKSQAHHEANTLVQQIENPFWKSLLSILPSDRYSDLAALPAAQAKGLIGQLLELNANYMSLGNEFAKGGSDEAKVWEQSKGNTQPPLRGFLDALSIAEASGKVAPGGGGSVGTTLEDLQRMYPGIQGFATGTDYVPKTGIYQLHQGEAVIPSDQNRGGITIEFSGPINLSGNGMEAADSLFDQFIKRIQQNRSQLKYRLRTALA